MAADVSAGPFVDFYQFLGSDPDLAVEELKKLYHEKLREYHPDKRPESAGSTGARVTQSLNEAWEVLRDPQKKEAYDRTWRCEKEKALPAHERADLHRRKGNDLYGSARDRSKDASVMDLGAIHQSMKLYKSAMEEYTIAMESAPSDHRLYSNRALCYLAVEDWGRARDDAQYCARLRPDFKKAWLLLTKALWKLGKMEEASDQLQAGLRYLPGCAELLELQADFTKEVGEASFRTASRSVSPVYTPTPSRTQTPTRSTYTPQGNRPVSPQLVAAGMAGIANSGRSPPGVSQTYAGPSSRSPGPASGRQPRPDGWRPAAPALDGSGTFQTGNFGAPTPVFADKKAQPSADALNSSFPANAHTMWAGNAGNSSHRSAYSPGPASGGQPPPPPGKGPDTGRKSSRSPGPSFGAAADASLSSARDTSRGASGGPGALRKSGSLRGMMEASMGRSSTSKTPPGSRGPTPPRPTR